MKKYIKICIGFVIMILISFILSKKLIKQTVHVKDKRFSIGKYVLFGKYNSKAVLWKVIDINNKGILLFSDKIITYKEFDEKENGHERGSSEWHNSNIQEWLNSQDKKVNFTTPYSKKCYNEPGFLYNFMKKDIKYIHEAPIETENDANTKNKVFLLSKAEWEKYVKDKEIGKDPKLTPECRQKLDKYTKSTVEDYGVIVYLLRTPDKDEGTYHLLWNILGVYRGEVCSKPVFDMYSAGIRPALYLKANTIILRGKGNYKNPFIISKFGHNYKGSVDR